MILYADIRMCVYIYTYIVHRILHIYVERERDVRMHVYIYIDIYISTHAYVNAKGTGPGHPGSPSFQLSSCRPSP